MSSHSFAEELINGYNNVIEHVNFFQEYVISLSFIKEKMDEAIEKNDEDAPALIIALQIQLDAGLLSGITNYPGILGEKIKVFKSLMNVGVNPNPFNPSEN